MKRLSAGKGIVVRSIATGCEIASSKRRSQPALLVSRLSDLCGETFDLRLDASATRQLVFLDDLPVEALSSRLLPLHIRNPRRIHIAAAKDAAATGGMIYRAIRGFCESGKQPTIVDAWVENEELILLSAAFERLSVPLKKLGRLIGDDARKCRAFEIDEDGSFLHWPHVDVHLGWTQFEHLVDPTSAILQRRKSARFNRRYGDAIRRLRELRELRQADVRGITARQLRRVESGEQAASKATLEALAKSHNMSLDDYLQVLANLVSERR